MLTWISYLTLIFFILIIVMVLKPKNFVSLLFLSELIWILLYCMGVLLGSIYNDITLLSMSFFILGIAGLEFSIGILVSILYKNLNESLNLDLNNKFNNQNIFDKIFKSPVNNL